MASMTAGAKVKPREMEDMNGLGSLPPHKTWWCKWISEDLYVAGRLSQTQLQYAAEDGFKTVVSVFKHNESGEFGDEILPTTDEMAKAAEICRLKYLSLDVTEGGDRKAIKDTFSKFSETFDSVTKPVLLYSDTGFTACFLALLKHVAGHSRAAEQFYFRASVIGYDYTDNVEMTALVSEVTGETLKDPIKPQLDLPNWYQTYWWMKPLGKNWFTSGQIHRSHLQLIKALGIKSIVNSRRGMTFDGEPSQEEVALLNVKISPTYAGKGRQTPQELEKYLVNPNMSSDYIKIMKDRASDGEFGKNYQMLNYAEFGDDVGYNETLEREAVAAHGLDYYHTPISVRSPLPLGYGAQVWRNYQSVLQEATHKGPVLAQCMIGLRATVSGVAYLGHETRRDIDWATETARLMGYDRLEADPEINNIFQTAFAN